MPVSDPSAPRMSSAGWWLSLYPDAGEAGGSFRYSRRPKPAGGPGDPERAKLEAARRARGKMRRYCAANRLNRLGTLTYRASGQHDPRALRLEVAEFFRALRGHLGGDSIPYVWVSEWHKTDHGLHVHFAVGRYIARRVIERSWPHGFVHIKLLGDLQLALPLSMKRGSRPATCPSTSGSRSTRAAFRACTGTRSRRVFSRR